MNEWMFHLPINARIKYGYTTEKDKFEKKRKGKERKMSHSTVTSDKCTTAEHRSELVAHRYQRFEFVT